MNAGKNSNKEIEKRLDLTHSELKVLKHALDQSVMVAIADKEGSLKYVNNKFCEISKFSRNELIGKYHPAIDTSCHPKEMIMTMEIWKTIDTGKVWTGEVQNRAKDGSHYWADTTIVPFLNEKGKTYRYLFIQMDTTQYKSAEKHVHFLTYYDRITELPNRILFQERLTLVLAEAKRHKHTMSILFLDLDRFKLTNESLGHSVGDCLLKGVAERLKKCLRLSDFVARMGGDEFMLLLPIISKEKDVIFVIDRLSSALKQPFQIGLQEVKITASIGVSIYPNDGEDTETLLRNAEIALNQSKETGRGRFNFYAPHLHKKINQAIKLESALGRAIEREELRLHYQPLVSLKTGKIKGMEALLRWERPGIGLISPVEFIPVAEESGLIIPIGEWVMRTAFFKNSDLISKGYPPLTMAVNVSSLQFEEEDFVEKVAAVVADVGLETKFLKLEMTESLFMKKIDTIIERLERLKETGVQLSIDDFGTGFSSLSYLKRFPVDSLKIDRSFVNDIAEGGDDAKITTAIIVLAHSLELEVVAEGIETEEQLIYLQEHQCDLGQGYLFSRPVREEDVEALLTQRLPNTVSI